MEEQKAFIFGIDLGTTYSCISYVDEYGKAVVIPNQEHRLTTPSVIMFEDDNRIVGEEAKNNAMLNPDHVIEMVKRHMGEADWHFPYGNTDYTPEEVSSYILRKLAADTEATLNIPVKDVVITCPAYFGIAQREATARAGEIAGLNVHEVINEPTAAAIAYGMQNAQDQTVLVYDLGGGTFDITIIEINEKATTVVATGGDYHLGGRNWDEAIITYLAEQWQEKTGLSVDPLESAETVQDLWLKSEKAKWALTVRSETKVVVSHTGKQVGVTLTREKFNELTASLLDRTVLFTKMTMDAAKARGYTQFDRILLVGGSVRMPQVAERLEKEFNLPLRLFEPDEAVAKGAALYGQRLRLRNTIQAKAQDIAETVRRVADINKSTNKIAQKPRVVMPDAEEVDIPTPALLQAQAEILSAFGQDEPMMKKLATTTITNVASHSFGLVVTIDYETDKSREVISNLVRVNDKLPVTQIKTYGTLYENQENVYLKIMENTEETWVVEQGKYTPEAEVGVATLVLPPGLPADAPIEVMFKMNIQGRLRVVGREPDSHTVVKATFQTRGGMTREDVESARTRAKTTTIS